LEQAERPTPTTQQTVLTGSRQYMALYPQWVVAVALEMSLITGVQAALAVAAVTKQQAVQELLVKAMLVGLAQTATRITAAAAVAVKTLLAETLAHQLAVMAARAWRG
jgi:hypothetical protein